MRLRVTILPTAMDQRPILWCRPSRVMLRQASSPSSQHESSSQSQPLPPPARTHKTPPPPQYSHRCTTPGQANRLSGESALVESAAAGKTGLSPPKSFLEGGGTAEDRVLS